MRKINFKKLQPGDLVDVPRYEFAPLRQGWNGWLFSPAVVIRKGIGKKSGREVVVVEMMIPAGVNQYKTTEKTFFADCVFQYVGIESAKHFLQEYGVKSPEDFEKFKEEATGCDWISFLIDKGFVTF